MGIFTEKDKNASTSYVDTSITNVSGSLSSEINLKPDTLLELQDTPSVYDENKYLRSTVSGIEWGIVTFSGTSVYFDAYDATGGTTVLDSWTDVPLTTERQKTDEFSHGVGSSELIIDVAGVYIIMARATTSITTGTNRTDSSMRLVIDTGGGYTEVPGTYAVMYNRTLNRGENTGNVSVILNLNSDDRIKIQVKRDDGSSSLELLANGSSLSVFSTTGQKGEAGADGAPGAGTSVTLKEQSTTVSGSPFSILNFTGTAVRKVEDQGGSQAEIYIEPLFGSWYGWYLADSESSTNSTSWINKASYTSPTIPNGYYRIGYTFEWRRDATGNDFKARVQINNTTDIMNINEESKDPNSWHLCGGFQIVALSEGIYTIDLDFSGESTGNTSYIRNARLEFWMITEY